MSISKTKAQACLSIQAVRLQSSQIDKKEDTRAESIGELVGSIYGFHGVSGVLQRTATASDEKQLWIYDFHYKVGVKVAAKNDDEANLVEIKSTYCVEYYSNEELSKEDIHGFSKDNVGYHVWPYWREYVQSTLSRMDLPAKIIKVPFYFAARTSESDE